MKFSEALLAWYDGERRSLPWRGTRDPYRVWLSEIMLQQTRTETVTRYYRRFLERFPTVNDLAAGAEDEVLKLWEGLGYYSRARNLHAAAKRVAEQGAFPEDAEGLRALPGVGPYAANAIASIAYGEPVPALDGNQARVLSRVLAHDAPLKTPFDLLEPAAAMIDRDRPGDYNQALMDLGASLCAPKNPDCARCPVAAFCRGFASGDPESFPRKAPPIAPREEDWTVAVAVGPEGFWLRRRPSKGLLGGLYEFPMLEGHLAPAEASAALTALGFRGVRPLRALPPARHRFTHLLWQMEGVLVRAEAAPESYRSVADLSDVALPSALRAYREAAADFQRADEGDDDRAPLVWD